MTQPRPDFKSIKDIAQFITGMIVLPLGAFALGDHAVNRVFEHAPTPEIMGITAAAVGSIVTAGWLVDRFTATHKNR